MFQANERNGSGQSAAHVEVSPIPLKALNHFVALLASPDDAVSRFLQALPERVGVEVKQGAWIAVQQPRPCTYTDIKVGDWHYRLIFDPEGLPPALNSVVFPAEPSMEAQELVEAHRGCCLVFLTSCPKEEPELTGWKRFQGLTKVAWAWLDAGAELLCFPEARCYLPRRLLLPLEPEQITPEHCYLFVSNGVASTYKKDGKQNVWLRTWGLAQFGLPELAAHLTMDRSPEELETTMESLRLLMETLPPAMVRDHGILPEGGQVQVGSTVWRAISAPRRDLNDQPFLVSRFGVQLFEQA